MVVLGEVAGLGAADAEDLLEPARGVLRHVLIERAGRGASLEDALDGAVLERAEARGVSERGVDVTRLESGAQAENVPCMVTPGARGSGAHEREEARRPVTETGECGGELVEIDRALPSRRTMKAERIEFASSTPRSELVPCNAFEVGGVDEEL